MSWPTQPSQEWVSKSRAPMPSLQRHWKILWYNHHSSWHMSKAWGDVPCPNIGCDDKVPRCDLSNHRSTCQFEKVPCTYAEIGCEEEPLRKDIEQHENDDAVHLHLAIKTVNELQKRIKLMGDNVATCPCVFKMPQYHQHKSSKQQWYSPPFYTSPVLRLQDMSWGRCWWVWWR